LKFSDRWAIRFFDGKSETQKWSSWLDIHPFPKYPRACLLVWLDELVDRVEQSKVEVQKVVVLLQGKEVLGTPLFISTTVDKADGKLHQCKVGTLTSAVKKVLMDIDTPRGTIWEQGFRPYSFKHAAVSNWVDCGATNAAICKRVSVKTEAILTNNYVLPVLRDFVLQPVECKDFSNYSRSGFITYLSSTYSDEDLDSVKVGSGADVLNALESLDNHDTSMTGVFEGSNV
jgi:hypothetical protein